MAAMTEGPADAGSYRKEYKTYDAFQGKTFVVDLAQVDQQAQDFEGREWLEWRTKEHLPLGWDLEWVPDKSKEADNPIALMQLADDNVALLLRTHRSGSWLPDSVREALLSEDCKKVAVGYDGGDKRKMRLSFGFEPNGILDLCPLAKDKGLPQVGLKFMAEHFGWLMKKESRVARSNWACGKLSPDQERYAAEDAYFTFLLLEKLRSLPDASVAEASGDLLRMQPGWSEQGLEARSDGIWCRLCERGPMTMPMVIHQHIRGQKHVKKFNSKQEQDAELKTRTPERLQNLAAQGIVLQADGVSFRCTLCAAGPFLAMASIDIHLQSKKHQKASGNKILNGCCSLVPDPKQALAQQHAADAHGLLAERLWNLPDYVTVVEDNALVCNLCSSRPLTVKSMVDHLDGAQHSKTCRAQGLEEVIFVKDRDRFEWLSDGEPVVRSNHAPSGLAPPEVRHGAEAMKQQQQPEDEPPVPEYPSLPPGWRMKHDANGQPYYADIQMKVTSRRPPRAYEELTWERMPDAEGRPFWRSRDLAFYERDPSWRRYHDPAGGTYWSNEVLGVRFWEPEVN
eukprot:TRINITY_DN51214_c0_g1_i1.p1 TRINITY_DN51214_c0_g1~~TRINITY_DN51214_c0_g1_i1.p1  ORF type:complete len:567 (+),score=111.70 TRINITY_DN51214_c0_g1_i1:139-1839(+)